MKLNELKPPAPPEPPAAWKLQFEQFWQRATDLQRIDMRVALAMKDSSGAQRILESWQTDLNERRKSRKKKKKSARRKFQYGVYGGWFYPGYHNDSGADSSSDGADGGGGESIQEQQQLDLSGVLEEFLEFCCDELGIQQQPRIRLRRDPVWSERNGTFGRFNHDHGYIELAVANRHPMDVLRTLAHELVHHRQAQDQDLPADAGAAGSDYEDEANARAGELMRHWADRNPNLFGQDLEEGWRERAAGLAAAACVVGTPGCATTGTTTAADALRTVQTVGRAAQNLPTRAGAEEELRQELRNFLRRQRGEPEVPGRVVREASGYIPTAAEKDDPRFSMALTQDIRPGETGRQANKLGLKTDSQGRPDLLMKKLGNLLESVKRGDIIDEDEDLQEVAMNPGAYRRFLDSKDSEGIRAGFEAELIFRDAQADPDEGGESEPDYDADERAYGIQEIIDFFTGGENGISRRRSDRLSQELTEQYYDWAREQFANEYFDQDRFMSWAEDNIWEDEADNYREDARANLDDDATDEDVEREAVTLFRDDVERDWDRSGDWYERASEEMFDEYMADLDQSDWLDSEGLRFMSDVSNEYDLDWPYWTDGGGGGGGSRSWEDIGNSLGRATGLPVKVSSGYHSAARRPGQYIIEPDGSLQADVDETGLEIVSPPLPLAEALEQLKRVVRWANDSNEGNAYTNSSTGLHMGMSLPYKGGDVDPIKLILFMGDKELLERFDRQSNTYAASAWDRLQSRIGRMRGADPKQIAEIMELMKKNLIELAHRDLQSGVLGNKYVSVNPHQGYIEFRGPGGDYLATEDRNYQVLENTMLQLAYAMHIAGSPDLYRDEYAKKLYKSLSGYKSTEIQRPESVYVVRHQPSGEEIMVSAGTRVGAVDAASRVRPEWTNTGDLESTLADRQQVRDFPARLRYTTRVETADDSPFMRMFADYSAGRLSGQALKKRWADAVVKATQSMADDGDPVGEFRNEYEVYDQDSGTRGDRDSRTVIDTFRADSDQEAMNLAQEKWDGHGVRYGVRRKIQEPDKPQSPRLAAAQRLKDLYIPWMVQADDHQAVVQARTEKEALEVAGRADSWFARHPDTVRLRGEIRPATDEEIKSAQTAVPAPDPTQRTSDTPIPDEAPRSASSPDATHALYHTSRIHRDSRGNPDLRAPEIYFTAADDAEVASMVERYNRHHGPGYVARPVAGAQPVWRVSWTERRDDGAIDDSTRIQAGSAQDAIERLVQALRLADRRGYAFRAEPVGSAASAPAAAPAAANTDIGQPRVTAGTPGAGEWTGHWIVRDARGRELTRFHGIGNSQADANRYALRWLTQNGHGSGTEVEVVPEMR